MPLTLIASLIDPVTLLPRPATQQRLDNFTRLTNLPFYPPLSAELSEFVGLSCPRCDRTGLLAPMVNTTGSGYAQPGFTTQCPHCAFVFNKAMIGVRRFCEEYARRITEESLYFSSVGLILTSEFV